MLFINALIIVCLLSPSIVLATSPPSHHRHRRTRKFVPKQTTAVGDHSANHHHRRNHSVPQNDHTIVPVDNEDGYAGIAERCRDESTDKFKNKGGLKELVECCLAAENCDCLNKACSRPENEIYRGCNERCVYHDSCDKLDMKSCGSLPERSLSIMVIILIILAIIVMIGIIVAVLVVYKKKFSDKRRTSSIQLGSKLTLSATEKKKKRSGDKRSARTKPQTMPQDQNNMSRLF